jgi:hypothetical protein
MEIKEKSRMNKRFLSGLAMMIVAYAAEQPKAKAPRSRSFISAKHQ